MVLVVKWCWPMSSRLLFKDTKCVFTLPSLRLNEPKTKVIANNDGNTSQSRAPRLCTTNEYNPKWWITAKFRFAYVVHRCVCSFYLLWIETLVLKQAISARRTLRNSSAQRSGTYYWAPVGLDGVSRRTALLAIPLRHRYHLPVAIIKL